MLSNDCGGRKADCIGRERETFSLSFRQYWIGLHKFYVLEWPLGLHFLPFTPQLSLIYHMKLCIRTIGHHLSRLPRSVHSGAHLNGPTIFIFFFFFFVLFKYLFICFLFLKTVFLLSNLQYHRCYLMFCTILSRE